jgi:hypothetical protein
MSDFDALRGEPCSGCGEVHNRMILTDQRTLDALIEQTSISSEQLGGMLATATLVNQLQPAVRQLSEAVADLAQASDSQRGECRDRLADLAEQLLVDVLIPITGTAG